MTSVGLLAMLQLSPLQPGRAADPFSRTALLLSLLWLPLPCWHALKHHSCSWGKDAMGCIVNQPYHSWNEKQPRDFTLVWCGLTLHSTFLLASAAFMRELDALGHNQNT